MKEIKLTLGKVAIVDDEDFEYLSQWKWTTKKHRNTFYARRNMKLPNGKNKDFKMHRVIMGVTDPRQLVDHRDNDGLNNQKSNLRPCSLNENQHNRISRKGSSKFKGVRKDGNKWYAQIMSYRVKRNLGSFDNEIDAAKAYNDAAIIYHGEFAHLNQISA